MRLFSIWTCTRAPSYAARTSACAGSCGSPEEPSQASSHLNAMAVPHVDAEPDGVARSGKRCRALRRNSLGAVLPGLLFVDGNRPESRIHQFAGAARLHLERFLFYAAPSSIPRHQRNVDRPIA